MLEFQVRSFVKNMSSKISEYTKYVHLFTYLIIWLGMISGCWMISRDPVPLFGLLVLGSMINLCIGLVFWFLPSLIIKWKKRKGKNWSGLLTVLNLFLLRFVAWPIFTFSIFFVIAGLWMRGIDAQI